MKKKELVINHLREYLVLYLVVVIAIVFSINTSYAVSTYTVEFDLNGGTGAAGKDYSAKTVTEGEFFQVYNPSKEGYIFNGWKPWKYNQTNAYIGGTINKYYREGVKLFEPHYDSVYLKDIGNADTTAKLIAQWKVPYDYTIDFDLNGGSTQNGYDYAKRKIKEQEIIAIGDPTKTGYKFIGWKLDSYDKNNAFIVGNDVHDYIKNGHYDASKSKWLDHSSLPYIWVKNIGNVHQTLKLTAQWEEQPEPSASEQPAATPNTNNNETQNNNNTQNNNETQNNNNNNTQNNNATQNNNNNNTQNNNTTQNNNNTLPNNNTQNDNQNNTPANDNNIQNTQSPETGNSPQLDNSPKNPVLEQVTPQEKEEGNPKRNAIIFTLLFAIFITSGIGIYYLGQRDKESPIKKED